MKEPEQSKPPEVTCFSRLIEGDTGTRVGKAKGGARGSGGFRGSSGLRERSPGFRKGFKRAEKGSGG